MNIKITYNWLLEYLDTDADPYELQKYLSLCGPSFERVDKVGDDYVFDIEVTTNRVDMASVFGIAQEATAILPQFRKKAVLKTNPLKKFTFDSMNVEHGNRKQLDVEITDPSLCPRFTAMVISNIAIKPSPEIIQKRLQMCDIKAINNIVDISNYLMLSLGQPTHMFDYDKIAGHKMIMRESRKGEKIVTLDDKELTLPGGDIVIEDGDGKLMDLCGIMGGASSAISEDTTTVVFFVQTYDKRKIRRTSMTTGQRTVAATYFEKGLDTERVETTFVYGMELLTQNTEGIVDSQLYDIYHHKYEPKKITTYLSNIDRVMGVPIEEKRVQSILENLGFEVNRTEEEGFSYPESVKFKITVPSYRKDDIEIKEDIIEEVARVYGYHNLPNNIQPTVYIKQPRDIEMLFVLQQKIKYFFKHLGLNEVMNYSMISKEVIEKLDMKLSDHLQLANTISEEIKYMRTTLVPSLVMNLKGNQGKKDELTFFEISKVYKKREGDLPEEKFKLAIATNTDFFTLKGIMEALFEELHISNYHLRPSTHYLFTPRVQAEIYIGEESIGKMGQLKTIYQDRVELKDKTYILEIDFQALVDNYKLLKPYTNPTSYSTIKLDLNIEQREDLPYAKLQELAYSASSVLRDMELLSTYQNTLTVRFYFSSPEKNMTEEEGKKELEKIKSTFS